MTNQENSIAVIGMAGIFPDASNISEFYSNLRAGRDSIRPLSLGRISYSSMPYDKDYQVRGFLDRVDLFDYKFFNISLREAEQMDPTQRILLEKTCEAIWNAGYSLKEFDGTNTAVYLGGDPYADYPSLIENYDATIYSGNLHSMLCGRISYMLNLNGPSMMIDTSCSSSLVAVHEACQKLVLGETDCAIAGGIFIITSFPEKTRGDGDIGINSPDGRSKTFDAAADGTGGGEGGGIVVLKRLQDARRDGDNILAIIRGGAVNHGGRRSNGITAPSPAAQTELLIKAWKTAGINPEEISYIEVHGTGTKLGDPIEFKGITDAFNHFTSNRKFCALSAVKTNIGHLNNGAGVTGLIKCILSLNNGEIFPSLHFRKPNPFIVFESSAAYVNTKLMKWPAERGGRKCAVSSFGMSGTNVHVVLEENRISQTDALRSQAYFVKMSAKSIPALRRFVIDIQRSLKTSGARLEDIIYTLNRGRDDHNFRAAVNVQSREQLCRDLDLLTSNLSDQISSVEREREIVVMFSDECLDSDIRNSLYEKYPSFRENVDQLTPLLKTVDSIVSDAIIDQCAIYRHLEASGFVIAGMIATGIGRLTKKILNGEIEIKDISVNLRDIYHPVDKAKFKKAVSQMINDNIFVEVGCVGKLSSLLDEWQQELQGLKWTTAIDTRQTMSTINVSGLYLLGAKIDWNLHYSGFANRRVGAPYPTFEKTRCWGGIKTLPINNEVSNWCYEYKWIEVGSENLAGNYSGRNVLIVSDSSDGLQAITDAFSNDNTITALRIASHDSEQMLKEINAVENPDDIIFFAESDPWSPASYNEVSTLFQLIRTFAARFGKRETGITLVTRHGFNVVDNDNTQAINATVLDALLKSALSDNPDMKILSLDFDKGASLKTVGEKVRNEMSSDNLLRFAAFRNGKKYVRNLTHLPFSTPSKSHVVKKNGVYIVTGGASGLGLEVCNYLAAMDQVVLLIFGRTPLPPRNEWTDIDSMDYDEHIKGKVRTLRKIQEGGSEVCYYAVDISDANALSDVFKSICEDGRHVDGVIHAAGVSSKNIPIAAKTNDDLARTFAPKVAGTINLVERVRSYNPEFFICFSSLNAVVPQKNTIDYAAANAFLDAFATCERLPETDFKSINWPGWKDTGMSAGTGMDTVATTDALSSKEGIEVFHYVLNTSHRNVIVSKVDLAGFAINPFFTVSDKVNYKADVGKPSTLAKASKTTAEKQTTEDIVLQIWTEVLKCDTIALTDDFFEIGGHSLNGTQVINRIDKEFGLKMEFEELYDYATVSTLAKYIDSKIISDSEKSSNRIIPVESGGSYFSLSHGQKRIWTDSQLDESGTTYNMQMSYRVSGEINRDALLYAFTQLIARHEVLRTSFEIVDNEVKQRITTPAAIDFNIPFEYGGGEDISLLNLRDDEVFRAFDLTQAPLIRVKLLKRSHEHYYLLLNVHHIISDGWSSALLMKELSLFYENYISQRLVTLPSLKLQYKDYAAWELKLLGDYATADQHRIYWKKMFSDGVPRLELATDYKRPHVKTYRGAVINFEIDPVTSTRLIGLARDRNVSLFMLMLASTTAILYHETRQTDIVIGAPVSGRFHPDLENLLGLFINTIPLRVKIDPSDKFVRFLELAKSVVLEALKHQSYPFDKIVEDIGIERDIARSPLFDVLLEVQEDLSEGYQSLPGLAIEENEMETRISKYDLSIAFVNSPGGIMGSIEYNPDLFRERRIQYMAASFSTLFRTVTANCNAIVNDLLFSAQLPAEKTEFEEMNF